MDSPRHADVMNKAIFDLGSCESKHVEMWRTLAIGHSESESNSYEYEYVINSASSFEF